MDGKALWATATLAAALAATLAAAQDGVTLQGGFTPDPVLRPFAAQGAEPAAGLVRGCPGHVAAAPALVLRLEGANTPLRLFARGSGLASVVSVGPDGVYRCGAADAQGVAHVRYDRALSGDYAVWAASTVPGAVATGEFLVSEIDIDLAEIPAMAEGGAATSGPVFEVNGEPAWGFATPDDIGFPALALTTAPVAALSALDPGCSGEADPARPDVVLTLGDDEREVHIRASAALDATLALVAPSGAVFCVDDTVGTDPILSLYDPEPGEYALWVGAWNDEEGPVTLGFSRTAYSDAQAAGGGAVALNADAPPAWGGYALPASGPLTVGLTLSALEQAGAVDPACSGGIDPSRPDVVVSLGRGEPALHISAVSAVDTTLVVLGPDGAVHCNDDAAGFNPALAVYDAAPGDWLIWVGVWGGAEGSAELTVDRVAPAALGETPMDNPFAGRRLDSAVQALDILMAEDDLGDVLSYGRIEQTGREGFILHDVAVRDPEGQGPALGMARLIVSDLDLEGLSRNGAAERFAVRMEGVDYAALAAATQAGDTPPLPFLDPVPTVDFGLSFLPPDGDAGRRAVRLDLDVVGWLALSLDALVQWVPGAAVDGPPDIETLVAEAMAVEVRDTGFVAAAMAAVAEQQGMTRDALVEQARAVMTLTLPQGPAGGPVEQLRAALGAKLDALDAPGVLRLSFAPDAPAALGAVIGGLAADPVGGAPQGLSIDYAPLP